MKTVTITIPSDEARKLLDNLPIAQYPSTLIALADHFTLTEQRDRTTLTQVLSSRPGLDS